MRDRHHAENASARQIVAIREIFTMLRCFQVTLGPHPVSICPMMVQARSDEGAAFDGARQCQGGGADPLCGKRELDIAVENLGILDHHACDGQLLAQVIVEGDVPRMNAGFGQVEPACAQGQGGAECECPAVSSHAPEKGGKDARGGSQEPPLPSLQRQVGAGCDAGQPGQGEPDERHGAPFAPFV